MHGQPTIKNWFIDKFITRNDTDIMMAKCQTEIPPLALPLIGWSFLQGNQYSNDSVLSR
jgi:hypothetical protein